MATDRDVNECGLSILDAIVKRKNTAELFFVLMKQLWNGFRFSCAAALRNGFIIIVTEACARPAPIWGYVGPLYGAMLIHFLVHHHVNWNPGTVLCTDLALCDVSAPYSSCRFLWGQPSASCSGLPEGLFSRVWSQSERSKVQRSSCDHRPSSQRGSITHSWHQSTAHKYPTHWRDCKIIWVCFFFLTWLFFLLYFLI